LVIDRTMYFFCDFIYFALYLFEYCIIFSSGCVVILATPLDWSDAIKPCIHYLKHLPSLLVLHQAFLPILNAIPFVFLVKMFVAPCFSELALFSNHSKWWTDIAGSNTKLWWLLVSKRVIGLLTEKEVRSFLLNFSI
jgi:hypothetical protein